LIVPESLSSDLREHGVSASAFVTLGTRPSILRALPAFWSAGGSRVLWVEGDQVVVAEAAMNHRRLKRVLAQAHLADIEVAPRMGGRQLMVRFPSGERVVIDGRSEVQRASVVLREGPG